MKTNPALSELKSDLIQQVKDKVNQADASGILNSASGLEFPFGKNEEWKYSPFSPQKGAQFVLKVGESEAQLNYSNPFGDAVWHLVFLDGFLVKSASTIPEIAGIQFFDTIDSHDIQKPYESTLFNELNRATATLNGLTIHIADGVGLDKPILLHHHFSKTETGAWVQPRVQVSVGSRAQASFIEWWEIPESVVLVSNSVTEISQKTDSMIRWTNLEKGTPGWSQIHQTRVHLEERAFFQHLVVAFGEGFTRNNLEIEVAGTQADAHMYGLCLGNHKLHVDNHTFVNHKEENTTSNQLYKTIMAAKSTAVFNGKILVDQKAQKTNAYQSSKNLLLSADAKVYAKPQLEIFADDVKCSHGATIGQLDEEPIFYLRSRGLDEKSARKMLIQAFASEILGMENFEPLRVRLQELMGDGLEQMILEN